MNHSFSYFEQAINRVAMRREGMPQGEVVLNRLLYYVARTLDDRYDQFLADYGLSTTSFLALAMIYSSETQSLNPSDLSDALISSRTNVPRPSNELAQAGWVDRRPSSEDRRRVELSMTKAGNALLERVFPGIWAHTTRQWIGLTRAELKELERLLRKLLGNLGGVTAT